VPSGRDSRAEAAERATARIEQGIARYAAGDIAASALEFEEALRLCPGHELALRYLGWVRALQAGRQSLGPEAFESASDGGPFDAPGPLDQETLAALNDALEQTDPGSMPSALRGQPEPPHEAARQSAGAREAMEALDWSISSSAIPKPAPSLLSPAEVKPSVTRQWTNEPSARRASSSTLLGISPATGPKLIPPGLRTEPQFDDSESSRSSTQPWSKPIEAPATLRNAPPLDVPELSDEQLQQLVRLEEVEVSGGRLEMFADPEGTLEYTTRRAPSDDNLDELPTLTPLLTAEERAFLDTPAPTRPRRPSLPPMHSPVHSARFDIPEEVLELPPPPDPPRAISGTLGSKRTGVDTNQTAALEPVPSVQAALDAEDPTRAFDAAEEFVTQFTGAGGGLSAARCRPQHWLLERAYELYVGNLDAIVGFGKPSPDLDPRLAFFLSRVDGTSTADELIEVSGMPRLEAMRTLALLLRRGVLRTQ